MASRRDRSISFGGELSRPKLDSILPASGKLAHQPEEEQEGLKRFRGLEDLFAHRPQKDELINRNILRPDNVSGVIQGVQEQLKKQIIEDHLKDKLVARPVPEKLIEQNIMKDSTVAPALQAPQQDLIKSQLQDSLGSSLSKRPSEKDLSKILHPTQA
ncbi:uncharacterized protein SPPG_05835 [Spizellomyces punctatus DAOM BR117]|uniref:RPEL repeat protein n=1 Tax=Spizellomyces punctatus (strain DAOM BR117) TaxID=645134 RepID=A0A0L0HCE7_SPIPD|nr:uncharacterized protein SPPG_05835 [Spizellomyces punctatus DAOM BR117]KNC98867.1 hypothetical protein SPPG_05835 [Spizellomyces punctatus DAOM BR117]|eukprot:XP_016606907.1 hypothetical protein SPPG_05835 [Spizellomyces punctatus DAOM BR117]